MKRILLFGGGGKVGTELRQRLDAEFEIIRAPREVLYSAELPGFILAQKPDLIINAAAFNGMEQCQQNPYLAYLINTTCPIVMAEAAALMKIPFIHYSTDYVFEGYPKLDTDSPLPVGYGLEVPMRAFYTYSRSKALADSGITAIGGMSTILRVQTVYGRDFAGPLQPLAAMQSDPERSNPLKIIKQFCAPTSARLIADATAKVVYRTTNGSPHNFDIYDTFHLACRGGMWRKDFIRYIVGDTEFSKWAVETPTLPLPRPEFSYLYSGKFEAVFNYDLPTPLQDFHTTFPDYTPF